MNNFRNTVLRYGSYFLVFFLPFIYFGTNILYPHISSKTFFFYGGVEILVGFWIYALILDLSYRLSKKTFIYLIPIFLYVAWMTIAGVLAVNPELAFWSSLARGVGLLTLYHEFVFLIIIMSLVKKHGAEYVYRLIRWFINGGFILTISVWLGSAGFNLPYKFLQTDGGGGMTGNSSLAAAYLLFVIAFGFFLIFTKNVTQRSKWWSGSVIAFIIFSPIFIDVYGFIVGRGLLGSARGALLGIIIGILSACVGYLCLSSKKILRIFGIVSIILSIIVFSFSWRQLITPNTYLHEKFTEVASGTRFIFWDTAQKAMNERPWLGYGPDNYMIAFERYFNPKMLLPEYHYEGWNDRAHNIYYDTGVSGGYPAIILYALFILSILYALYEAYKAGSLNKIQTGILGGVVVGYIFQDLFYFDSVLSLMALFALAGIAYALGDSIIKKDAKKDRNHSSSIDPFFRNGIVIALFMVCAVSFMYFSYMPAQKAKAYVTVFATPFNKPFNELLQGSPMGNQWDVSGLAHDANNTFSNDPLKVKNNKEVLPYVQKDLNAMLEYLEEIAKVNKTDFRLYIGMVRLYSTKIYFDDTANDQKTRDHMLALLEHARVLSPTNPEVYWGIAQTYAWAGDQKGVERAYEQAIAIDPSIPTSHRFLLQFLQATGDKKLFEEELIKAQKDIPGFTSN